MTTDVKEMDKTIQVRAGHRSMVTRTIKDVERLLSSTDSEKDKLSRLKGYRTFLDTKLTVFSELNAKILEVIETERIDKEIDDCGRYEADIYTCQAKIDEILTCEVSQIGSTSFREDKKVAKARLPKLQVPKFKGDPLNYTTFWDSFNSAIHSNDSLTKVDKFSYLKGLLEGPAATAISGLNLTEANYEAALQILVNRFGDKQILLTSFMEAILDMMPVTDSKNVAELRNLFDQLESYLRNIQSLGIASLSTGPMLIPVLRSKIPNDIQLIITRSMTEEIWNIDEFLRAFHTELSAREKCNAQGTKTKGAVHDKAAAKQRDNYTTSALFANNKHLERRNQPCVYCKENHKSWNCHVVKDKKARKQLLRSERRCFNCLSTRHNVHECTSKFNFYMF